MSKKYTVCPDEVLSIAIVVIDKFHPDIKASGLQIEYQFATSDDTTGITGGPAVSVNGWPCAAKVKIIGLQDRVAGRGDAIITIDEKRWEELTEETRAALLDHELYHLMPQKEDDGEWKKDAAGRPKLKMRPHDVEIGAFAEIAKRHGEHSMEVKTFQAIFDEHGQAFFPWLLTLTGGEEKPAKKGRGKKPAAGNIVPGPGADQEEATA